MDTPIDRDPKPYLWKWPTVEAAIFKMTEVVSLQDAIRRNIGLINPRNAKGVQANLGLGLQCVLPGEQAISHRHTAAAIRFVVRGTSDAFNLGDVFRRLYAQSYWGPLLDTVLRHAAIAVTEAGGTLVDMARLLLRPASPEEETATKPA